MLHDEIIGPDVVKRADIRIIQRRNGSGFAIEALAELFLGNLYGDDTIQPCVTSLVHLAHTAGANGVEELIRSQASSGRKRHDLSDFTLPNYFLADCA